MLKLFATAAVLCCAMAAPAFADACGDAPYPPAIDKPAKITPMTIEAARADVMDQYKEVKAYQGQLKDYRACLDGQSRTDQLAMRAAQQKKDGEADVARLKQQVEDRKKIYDATVDSETQVATDFNTLHMAHCTRDTDPMICPKKP